MVKRFFSSVFRLCILAMVATAVLWGVAQVFFELPREDFINKWMVFSFSVVAIYHFKDFVHDLCFWSREINKSYNGKE